jgi:tRNA 2-thiouridine synthesizing protein A
MSHHVLDARRLLCPMPVIRAQQRVENLQRGDTLDVVCTDPGAQNDIPAWCRVHGHKGLGVRNENNELVVTIEVNRLDA